VTRGALLVRGRRGDRDEAAPVAGSRRRQTGVVAAQGRVSRGREDWRGVE
jgi:hypothetical protein